MRCRHYASLDLSSSHRRRRPAADLDFTHPEAVNTIPRERPKVGKASGHGARAAPGEKSTSAAVAGIGLGLPDMTRTPASAWSSTCHTRIGATREVNEDASLERADVGLWAVADGMGGHRDGALASTMVIEALESVRPPSRLSAFVERVEERLLVVNTRLRELAAREHTAIIGTTVAVLLMGEDHCACLWAGDSRIYRYRDHRLERLTHDHALADELVERGVLTHEQAAYHPQGRLLTRAVGALDRLCLDVDVHPVQPEDMYLLCTDGLCRELDDSRLAALVEQHADDDPGTTLLDAARGGTDDATVVVVRGIEAVPQPSPDGSRPSR